MPSVKRKPIPDKTKMTTRQMDNARLAIKTGQIVKNLQKAAAGEIEMTPVQVKCSEILLSKALPSLQATEVTQHLPEYASRNPLEVESEFQQMIQREIRKLPPDMKQTLMQELMTDGTLIEAQPAGDAANAIDPSPETGPRTSTAH